MTPIKGIQKALNQPFFVGLLTLSSRQWTPCSQRRSPVDPFQQQPIDDTAAHPAVVDEDGVGLHQVDVLGDPADEGHL